MAERANALHILTNNSGDYIKLHDGSTIGVNLKDDLRQYFTLLFIFDYRYDYYNWVRLKISDDKITDKDSDFINLKSDYYVDIPDEIIKYIKENAGLNNIKIPSTILDLNADLNSLRDDSYKLGKVPYLEIVDDEDIYYYIPKVIANENYKERAIVKSDLEKLDLLFKTSNSGSIDDLVLLDFYKQFKYKIENLKNKIIENDEDIKKSIEDELIDRLKELYKIKAKDGKILKKIEENIRKRAKSKEYSNFININEIKGGAGLIPVSSNNIIESLNKIKKKTTELDEIDINILKAVNETLENKLKKPNKLLDTTDDALMNSKDTKEKDKKSSDSKNTIDNYNYLISKDDNIKEFIGDNSIKNNIKYLKLIKYFSNLKYKSTGGSSESNNSKKLLNDLTIIYNNLKDIYIHIVEEYIKFNNTFKKTGKKFITNINYINPSIKGSENIESYTLDDESNKKYNKSDYNDDENKNNELIKKLSVIRLEFENDFQKLESFYDSIDKIEKKITLYLIDLYKELINLKETVYSVSEYTTIINKIILMFKLKTVEKSDIIIELKEKKNYLTNKKKEFENFKDLTGKKYSELLKFDQYKGRNGYPYSSYHDGRYYDRAYGGGSTPELDPSLNNNNSKLLLNTEIKKIEEKIQELNKIFGKLTLENLENLINQNPESDLVQIIKMLEDTLYNNIPIDISKNNTDTDIKKDDVDKNDDEKLIYQELWDDYNNGVKAKINSNDDASYFIYIDEGEKLKNRIILNDLDPELVLKINLQDKAIFLMLIFIIRTISVVIIELLIEYNIVKTLHIAISVYVLLYLSILAIFIVFINLDSYKLRIIFNYLNTHINTSNIVIHLVLFVIFAFLVVIIIQTDEFIKNIGDILDYTYIYEYLFNLRVDNILNTEFENNLSPDEKLKLLYRFDIVTMIIFIFTGALVIII